MSTTLQSLANERRSRIANLRNKRNLDKSEEEQTRIDPLESVNKSAIEKEDSDIKKISNFEQNEHIIDISEDSKSIIESSDLGTDSLPMLQIGKNETVEAIGKKIQEDIFKNLHEKAKAESLSPEGSLSNNKIIHNSDLKANMEPYMKKAKLRTEIAISKIIQDKYQESRF